MRIDLNVGAQSLPESNRSTSQGSVDGASAVPSHPLGEDQAQLSGTHLQVQSLVAQALQIPEIREEKVNSLRQAVLGGSYQPSPTQVAEAVFAHLVVPRAA
ncbi:MAG: flagellar biosynthesis anti-sigma factor FlgM [Candidatus Sulfotelmatobacter sp.]|jgi:flagellar biosynthesis anti-sigma factor FlgM